MKKFLIWFLILGAIAGGAAWYFLGGPTDKKNEFSYRIVEVVKSDIVRNVQATGIVTPRNSSNGIPVGAQVNGKIINAGKNIDRTLLTSATVTVSGEGATLDLAEYLWS